MSALWLLWGCLYISDDDVSGMLDRDGDGVSRPTDCDDADAALGGPSTWYVDADGDSVGGDVQQQACPGEPDLVLAGGDCDDDDPSIYPGATEACNEDDDDCDDAADEGVAVPTWFFDGDRDGYGDSDDADAVTACEGPEGHVDNGEDCDDADGTIHPGSDEVCDGVDQDCDDAVDDAPVDGEDWYADRDEDGFGNPDDAIPACSQPAGRVDNAEDCDDDNPDAWPGAPESWYDGVDQDCAGDSDYDADYDGYESEDHGGLDCADGDGAINPDAVDACGDGVDNDCDGVSTGSCAISGEVSLDEAYATLIGPEYYASVGQALAPAGDMDGDGLDDLLIGARGLNGEGSSNPGSVILVRGAPPSGESTVDTLAVAYTEGATNEGAGEIFAAPGDLNLDGWDDLVIGVPGRDDASSDSGAVYVIYGPLSGEMPLSGAALSLFGTAESELVGSAVSAAVDLDGGGDADLVVCARGAGDEREGRVYGWWGPLGSELDPGAAGLVIEGVGERAYLGQDIVAGDLDGDGLDDLVVGQSGVIHILYGPLSGSLTIADRDAAFTSSTGDETGYHLALAADVSGDGLPDLLSGGPGNDSAGDEAGLVHLVAVGSRSGEYDLADADAVLYGQSAGDRFGNAVDGAGDVDGDGFGDVIVGALGQDPYKVDRAGAAAVYLGPLTGALSFEDAEGRLVGGLESASAGGAVAGVGDIDGDGFDDVAVGAGSYYVDFSTGYRLGAVYLFPGGE